MGSALFALTRGLLCRLMSQNHTWRKIILKRLKLRKEEAHERDMHGFEDEDVDDGYAHGIETKPPMWEEYDGMDTIIDTIREAVS